MEVTAGAVIVSGFARFGSGEAGREGGLCAGRDFSWGGVVSLVMVEWECEWSIRGIEESSSPSQIGIHTLTQVIEAPSFAKNCGELLPDASVCSVCSVCCAPLLMTPRTSLGGRGSPVTLESIYVIASPVHIEPVSFFLANYIYSYLLSDSPFLSSWPEKCASL